MTKSFIARCFNNNNTILEVSQHYIITKCDKHIDMYNTWVELGEDEFMLLSFSRDELGEYFFESTSIVGDLPSPSRSNKPVDEEIDEAENYGLMLKYYSGVRLLLDTCLKCGEWYAVAPSSEMSHYCGDCI